MTKIKMFVGLKIPDATAFTAFNTLKRLGHDIKELKREDYYEFEWLNDSEKFSKDIQEVDILVNSNKNYSRIGEIEKEEGFVYVLVKDTGHSAANLMTTLQERMGFHDIEDIHKGVLWKLKCSKDTAKKIAEELLYNEHYQEFEIL